MKLKLIDLTLIRLALSHFENAKFPFKTTYELHKFSKSIDDALAIYRDKRNDLLDRYVLRGEDGNFVVRSDDTFKLKDDVNLEEVERNIKDLDNYEIDVYDLKLSTKDFENQEISLSDLSLLDRFFID